MKKFIPIIIAVAIVLLIVLAAVVYVVIPFDFCPFLLFDDAIVVIISGIALIPGILAVIKCWRKLLAGTLTDEDLQEMNEKLAFGQSVLDLYSDTEHESVAEQGTYGLDEENTDYILLETGGIDMKAKYSNEWMENASLDELHAEREKVHDDYMNSDLDNDYRGNLWDLLHDFDNAIGKKEWEGQEPQGPSYHREHGWYLPNED